MIVDKLIPLLKQLNIFEFLWMYAQYVFPFDLETEHVLNILRNNLEVTSVLALSNVVLIIFEHILEKYGFLSRIN